MLLRFRVANVRSFREEQELSFVVQPGDKASTGRVVAVAGRDLTLYPSVGVFGANASGKSNLLAALVLMRDAVLNSYARWASFRGIPREEFNLDPKAAEDSSFFEVDFVQESVRYTYGFELGAGRVEAEWLHAYPKGRRQVWFDRDATRDTEFEFPGERVRDRAQFVRLTRPNALFLTVAGTNNSPELSPIFFWFERNLWLVTPENDRHQREDSTRHALRGPRRERIEQLLRVADLGVAGVELMDGGEAVRLWHDGAAGDTYPVAWERESFGTRSWFALLGPILLALDEGAVLLVDELDASLHPRFAAEVIRLFQDPEVNAAGAQLVFTTHDVTVLGTPGGDRLLDPGQVWLVEKDKSGATELYPLSAAQPGEREDLTRSYLAGRFGAVPALSEGQIARRLRATRAARSA
ncbi:AAA family ATPase [Phytohabitans suffuscus]|uniref:ATPase AAA-type core domain-containing protein n=1 Tax=Phytohabitans suffuscus TaxID=624315 RepID=A0A6F8YQQ4_9ACTN|nr:ATP-binding protein [Phytohabitans suffuscus]BCB88432.1 hypothetical protein Psuf_057450 [Phytohabitans suffuscus]